jgi:2-keto-3-deoxy-L-rhamnonate aldolase RhmA
VNLPESRFKRALREVRQHIGRRSLPGSYAAEAVAGSGYDWLLASGALTALAERGPSTWHRTVLGTAGILFPS